MNGVLDELRTIGPLAASSTTSYLADAARDADGTTSAAHAAYDG